MGSFSFVAMIAEASFSVKMVIILLFLLSVLSWSLIVYKGMMIMSTMKRTERLVDAMFSSPSLDTYVLLLESNTSHFLYKVFSVISKVKASSSKAPWQESALVYAQGLIVRQRALLDRGLSTLATIGNIAPFIGLFGTILGIINTMQALGGGETSLAIVAPGIGEALYLTAFGIFVSLPAVVAYNYLSAQLESYEDVLQVFTEQMIVALQG